ncbi:unnamed protein product [Effrenium voratum]|nr:unnamed protein product [Effrenium voratum]
MPLGHAFSLHPYLSMPKGFERISLQKGMRWPRHSDASYRVLSFAFAASPGFGVRREGGEVTCPLPRDLLDALAKLGSENRGQLHEAAVSAAAKLGLNRPPPPPPEPLAPGPVPGSAAPPSPTKSSAPRNSDDPMEAEIQRMMQLQQQEYQAKQIVKESATAKAGPIGPGPSDKSQASQGFRAMSFFGLSKSLRLQLAKHGVFLWRE